MCQYNIGPCDTRPPGTPGAKDLRIGGIDGKIIILNKPIGIKAVHVVSRHVSKNEHTQPVSQIRLEGIVNCRYAFGRILFRFPKTIVGNLIERWPC